MNDRYIGITQPLNIVKDTYANIDAKYGTYESINHALQSIPLALRKEGLTVGIIEGNEVTEYWFNNGIQDTNLIQKFLKEKSFLSKDTMVEMRALSAYEIALLNNGTYKGVTLYGYYEKGDTPAPINYYLSETTDGDDGGSVIIIGDIKLEHNFIGIVNVKYFGAKGDGITDDTESIQSASNQNWVQLNKGEIYLISDTITCPNNFKLDGNNSTIKIKDNIRLPYGVLYFGEFCENAIITEMTFDENMANMPIYQISDYSNGNSNCSIKSAQNAINMSIIKCKFINGYTEQVMFYQSGSNILIKDSYFRFIKPFGLEQNLRGSNIILSTSAAKILIEGNTFDNEIPSEVQYGTNGIFLAGVSNNVVIQNNYFNNCGRDNTGTHRLYPIDIYFDCTNITIINNIFNNCLYGLARINASSNVIISDNYYIHNSLLSLVGEPGFSINPLTDPSTKSGNISISNNKISVQTRIVDLFRLEHSNWDVGISDININNNIILGFITNVLTVNLGCRNISFANNIIKKEIGIDRYAHTLFNLIFPTNSIMLGDEHNSITDNIKIINNIGEFESGQIILANVEGYIGKSENIIISNNNIKGVIGMGYSTVHNIEFVFENNIISDVNYVLEIAGDKLTIIKNNIISNVYQYFLISLATNILINGNILDGEIPPSIDASPDTAPSPGVTYTQSEVQAIITELRDLKTKMRTAGLLAT